MLMKMSSLNYSFSIRERDIIFSSSRKSNILKESRSFGTKVNSEQPSKEFCNEIGKSASCFSLNLNAMIPEKSALVEETPVEKNQKTDKKEEVTFFKKRFGRNKIEEGKVEEFGVEDEKATVEDEKLKSEVVKHMVEDEEGRQESGPEMEEIVGTEKKEKSQRQEPGISTMQSDLREPTAYKKTRKRNKKQLKLASYKYYRSPYLDNINFRESNMPKSQQSQKKTKHKKIRATPRANEF
jgi:hypothetical protein